MRPSNTLIPRVGRGAEVIDVTGNLFRYACTWAEAVRLVRASRGRILAINCTVTFQINGGIASSTHNRCEAIEVSKRVALRVLDGVHPNQRKKITVRVTFTSRCLFIAG